jgi:hypothetical protein
MPVKKFKDPFQPVSTEKLDDSSKSSTSKITQRKSLKAPKSETASGSELSLRSPSQNGSSTLPQRTISTPGASIGKYNKDYLKERWTTLSGVIMTYLLEVVDQNTGRMRLHNLLDESKLKDIGIMAGIATEKVLLMSGQPTQIIAESQQVKLDDLGKALKETLEKRGIVTVTERKVEIKQDPK